MKQIQFSKDEKSVIMSEEVYMTRTSNAVNTETERIVNATQVMVNVTKKIRSTRIAFARDYKREKMRYLKFTHIVETTGPPIVTVTYGYQRIPTNKTKVRKIKVQKYRLQCSKITHILFILSKYYYAKNFSDSTLRVGSSRSKSVKLVPKCHLTLLKEQ